MKILAFAASNSRNSINRQLVSHAVDVLKSEIAPDAEVELLDLNDYELPIYSIDRENDSGIPATAQVFYDKIGAADGLVISYAEHNGNYTVAYKNIFDWASRINAKVFQGKPVLILGTSPGLGGAGNVLKLATTSAPHFGAELVDSISVGPFSEKFDTESGTLKDAVLAKALREGLGKLV